MRDDRERLLDILEALEKIEQRRTSQKSEFESDEMLQVWVVHYLQIIDEAASRITPSLRDRHPEIPWGKIIGTRQVLVHGYFDIDLDIVWATVHEDLPRLTIQIRNLISEMGEMREG